jgi:hypothetical protein
MTSDEFQSPSYRLQIFREASEIKVNDAKLVAISCTSEISTTIGEGRIVAGKWSVSPVMET